MSEAAIELPIGRERGRTTHACLDADLELSERAVDGITAAGARAAATVSDGGRPEA